MEYTEYYNLKKPGYDDPADVADLNDNADTIDSTLHDLQGDIDAHINDTGNPHGVTKSQVGLGNVDNVKQASKSEFDDHAGNANAHKGQKNSIELDSGDLQLVGDEASPGANKVYGTDESGNKGWMDAPSPVLVVEELPEL